MAYSKPKGTKGIPGAKGGSKPKQSKSKPSALPYCGIADSRPSNADRKQSAK
jgi:hypothetical protein